MAPGHLRLSLHIPILTILLLLKTGNCCFTRIFCFGDSISDTGNYLKSIGESYNSVRNLPYGETYFGHPTGRFSDGRLILDFIAEAYGLSSIPPYLSGESTENFLNGVNFAVAGATALDTSFFESMGIEVTWTNYSLGAQLEWFKKLLPSIFEEPGIDQSWSQNITGSKYFPDRMSPGVSCDVPKPEKEDYDPETGCIKRLNEFAEYHNTMLLQEIVKLRLLYSDVTIIYADYYEAFMSIIRNPKKLGFNYPLMACCGAGGPYNCSPYVSCGSQNTTVCLDPSKYVSWDGTHSTEAAYKAIAHGVLRGSYSSPPISNTCSDIMHDSGSLLLVPSNTM